MEVVVVIGVCSSFVYVSSFVWRTCSLGCFSVGFFLGSLCVFYVFFVFERWEGVVLRWGLFCKS